MQQKCHLLYKSGYNLDKKYQKHHRNRVNRGISDAGSRTIAHRVGRGQSRRTGHTSGYRTEQVQYVYLKDPLAETKGYNHRNQRYDDTDTKHGPSAFLEGGNQCTSGGSAYFGKEQEQSQLAQ